MAGPSQGRASYWTQANALLRKNLTFQKRNISANIRLIVFPFFLCILLLLIQTLINSELEGSKYKCGCTTINGTKVCGVEYSTLDQAASCPVTSPPEWPALLQIPSPEYRAIRTDSASFTGLPNESCRSTGTCPATVLLTGQNQTLGDGLVASFFTTSAVDTSDVLYSLAQNALGSDTYPENSNFLDSAFITEDHPLYRLQTDCSANSSISVPVRISSSTLRMDTICVQSNQIWRNSSSEINDELYKGYYGGNKERRINEILAAYDLQNSNENNFDMTVWYNATYKNDTGSQPVALLRLPRSVNMITNSYLKLLHGVEMLLEFVKEMPKPQTQLKLDLASVLGPLFFTWVILQLFPVILTSLVYEKEQRLRIMMKMHGLGDGPYWMITYSYFLVVSATYMVCFVLFGSGIGLKFFTENDYTIQFVFYFIYINLQISLAFLVAAMFSNVKTASVIGYIIVFGTGLLGGFLFQFFVEDESFSRTWVTVMELYPGFALFRGLYEFAQYASMGDNMNTNGMRWGDLNDSDNGLKTVFIIMFVEWFVVLFVAYYVDQVISAGSGVGRSPLFFLDRFKKKRLSSSPSLRRPSLDRQGSKVLVQMDKPDVAQEREKVEQLVLEPSTHAVVCDNLKKVYPSRDGNPPKFAVRGMSLALPQGECFGMLGPNGAGKTSFISMMIGLIKPSSGAAYVQGLDIRSDMNEIYNNMGVCPQHDLLWESLTGREHLLFYGRLKNLKGKILTQAVEDSLKGVNLFQGGVPDKQCGKYSGGMKRRLSVAISLIGDPKVVYMDEPSTGLDPASRNSLWNVVKKAKQNRAIILTTHSMEEAEVLCDRLGIFVDGSLQCIGNPKELKARYGGSYVFTMTTSSNNETEVENMVRKLSPNANKIYHLSGTQKFELPKNEVRIADVFQAVEKAKSKFVVHAWGLADTTLEDVFIKVARGAQSSNVLQ